MTIITKGMGVVLKQFKRKKLNPQQKEAKEKFRKHLEKKKGKELDWDDVKSSAKIFTRR
jgi:3-hydroxyacyl-CoA dehydrogenase